MKVTRTNNRNINYTLGSSKFPISTRSLLISSNVLNGKTYLPLWGSFNLIFRSPVLSAKLLVLLSSCMLPNNLLLSVTSSNVLCSRGISLSLPQLIFKPSIRNSNVWSFVQDRCDVLICATDPSLLQHPLVQIFISVKYCFLYITLI